MNPLTLFLTIVLLGCSLYLAYDIRLYAIHTYGKVIHEFDPWFNFRATQYLEKHGVYEFFHWYDHESWYPIGRPVGTTIYPGMQIVSVAIFRALNSAMINISASLNDVCVYFPVYFGVVATFGLFLLALEATGSYFQASIASLVMSIIPAHIMRSVGGGYDNESLAVSTMIFTFYFWIRSVRSGSTNGWLLAPVTALSYFAMVAAWGGYVFVLNMISLHTGILILAGRFNANLHHAFSLFYVMGTAAATFIPVVGWAPFRSAEQLSGAGIFILLQILYYIDVVSKQRDLDSDERWEFTKQTFVKVGILGSVVFAGLIMWGFFGPLSVRIRSLFFKHTRTGNPLVDSVAEHQPTRADAYFVYLLQGVYYAPIGLVIAMLNRSNGHIFIIAYALVSYYFAQKMNRLILLMGPVVSVLTGISIGSLITWIYQQTALLKGDSPKQTRETSNAKETKQEKKMRKRAALKESTELFSGYQKFYRSKAGHGLRIIMAVLAVFILMSNTASFYVQSHHFAEQISQPQLMIKARLRNGEVAIIDDYLKAYRWIKRNTPQDARVLSWWDYGYQIAGIANRTTLADGNTWSLEHIALIGKILTSPPRKAHAMAKHLCDYVLVWAGGGSDDLAKSPHIARIASSVYDDVCDASDPLCRNFGFYKGQDGQRHPTPSMKASLLYNMVAAGREEGARVPEKYFKEVHSTKYGLVRIYKVQNVDQESKKWLADPANYVCDAPGSWYCVGQYPKAIEPPPSTHRHIDYEKHGA